MRCVTNNQGIDNTDESETGGLAIYGGYRMWLWARSPRYAEDALGYEGSPRIIDEARGRGVYLQGIKSSVEKFPETPVLLNWQVPLRVPFRGSPVDMQQY